MSDEKPHIRIAKWDEFQHYKDRDPPWIKLYNRLLDDYEYGRLPDASKAHLTGLWMLASRTDNRIPLDVDWIAQKIHATEPVDLRPLLNAGFITLYHDDSETLSQDASTMQAFARSREAETETEAEDSGSSLPSVETSPPGEPGESDTPDRGGESDRPPHPTSREEMRTWVEDTPKPDSREAFASRHFVLGIYALWQGEDPPEKRPGPNYDMGAELRKLRQRFGAATNRELALFLAGVCLRRDEGEYGGVDPGEGMTLGMVDALNRERNGRSEWSMAKSRGQELMREEAGSAVDELLEGVGV